MSKSRKKHNYYKGLYFPHKAVKNLSIATRKNDPKCHQKEMSKMSIVLSGKEKGEDVGRAHGTAH